LDNVNAVGAASLITRKVLNEKILYYNILKSSRSKLQEYALKKGVLYFKKFKVTLP